jgi:CO/xanthine dehydrogenase FAD-binding subunit
MPPTTQCSQANLDCPSVNEELRSSRNLRAVSHQAITNESVAEWQMVQVPLAHQGSWYVPTSLKEILDLLAKYPGARIVAGNAASSWVRLFDLPTETKFISIKHVAEFTGEPTFSKEETHRVSFPPCTTLAHFLEFFQSLLTKKQYDVDSIVEHVKAIANIQVRNLGTIAGNVIAAQSRTGILHSDLGLILGAIQSFIWIQVLGEPELCIAIVDFLSDSNGGIPPEYSGKWVCTRISVELPVSGESTVRLARTSCRAYGNFPTLCSTAYSHYDGRTTIHFTGPHGVLHGVIPVEDTSSPGASLKFVRKFLENTTMFLTPAEKRLVIQMSARVLCIDGDDGKMAVSQAKERHLQGQSGEQAFFVDPTQAPVTEPMIKEAAYEHYTGKALYPQDTPPPVGTLNASPVVMPAAIVTFDAWLLKEAAENLLVPIDSKGRHWEHVYSC